MSLKWIFILTDSFIDIYSFSFVKINKLFIASVDVLLS